MTQIYQKNSDTIILLFIHKIDIVHYEAEFKPGWPMLYNLQLLQLEHKLLGDNPKIVT